MPSQPLAFAELLGGGILLTAGITGHSPRDILAGKASPLRPLTASPQAAPEGSQANAAFMSGGKNLAPAQLQGSGYVFPFGPGWTWERTDQGVDFAPSHTGAPILSPGNARVLRVGAPGWPSGGKGVLLHLLDGPYRGHNVFIYEAIQPNVRPGQVVRRGQQIGHGVFGETGVEIGFSDRNGVPLSHSEYTEGKETVWGKRMRAWLKSLSGRKP